MQKNCKNMFLQINWQCPVHVFCIVSKLIPEDFPDNFLQRFRCRLEAVFYKSTIVCRLYFATPLSLFFATASSLIFLATSRIFATHLWLYNIISYLCNIIYDICNRIIYDICNTSSLIFATSSSLIFATSSSLIFATASSLIFATSSSLIFATASSLIFATASSLIFATASSLIFATAFSLIFATAFSLIFATSSTLIFATALCVTVATLSSYLQFEIVYALLQYLEQYHPSYLPHHNFKIFATSSIMLATASSLIIATVFNHLHW